LCLRSAPAVPVVLGVNAAPRRWGGGGCDAPDMNRRKAMTLPKVDLLSLVIYLALLAGTWWFTVSMGKRNAMR
jgi:hypothetical protein